MTGDRTWAERSVLVTGATGMVGSALTQALVDAGARVTALVADHDPQSELIRSGTIADITVVDGRLEDVDAVERAVAGNDVEVDLPPRCADHRLDRAPVAARDVRVERPGHVERARRRRACTPTLVRSVVVASSDKAYGESPVLPYTEDMPLAGTFPYEVSKSMTDLVSRSYALTYGVPVAIARCGNIYGPGDLNWSRIVPGTFRSILRGEQPVIRSDGTFLRDYLHVDDVVVGLPRAGRRRAARTPGVAYNFSDESPASVLQIYAACCVAAGVPGLEPKILDQAVGEIRDQYLDASRARADLQWRAQTGLADGLARTFPWYEDLLGTLAMTREEELRKEILELTREYYDAAFPEKPFVGGISQIPVSGKVFDAEELTNLVDSSLDFWLTTGRYAEVFEKRFAKVMGVRHAMLVQLGLVGEPARGVDPHVAPAGQAPAARKATR